MLVDVKIADSWRRDSGKGTPSSPNEHEDAKDWGGEDRSIDVVVVVCLEEEGGSRLPAAGILVHFYVGIRRWGNYLHIKEIIANAGIFAQY